MENSYELFKRFFSFYDPMIYLKDINVKHRRLQHRDSNTQGRFLVQAIEDDRVRYLGLYFSTFVAGGHSGTLDAIPSNKGFYLNHLISPGLPTTSDHIPVVMTISARPINIPIRERLSPSQADWELCNRKCSEYTVPNLEGAGKNDIDAAVMEVTGFLSELREQVTPRITINLCTKISA